METLIRDALKDFSTFKELTETIPLEVLAAEAEGLGESQQQLFQEFSLRLTVPDLAQRVRQSTTWEEIEQVIASAPFLKQEIWALLTLEEKERIKILKITAALPIDPNCESLVGKRVFVTAGPYRQAGEGVIECDRGNGTLRSLEVRFPNGRIQFCSLSDARAIAN
ncbi:MAG: hypothetical protein M3O33_02920 [Cyanobacteriota bacterium]|nr:hypothetical protein [Cyanobacteriota bacterium]